MSAAAARRALSLAGLLAVALIGAAAAQEPPAQLPPDTRFPEDKVSFPNDRMRFPAGSYAFPSTHVAAQVPDTKELRFRLTADVLFAFDRAELRPEAEGTLRDLVSQIRKRYPGAVAMQVEGHTDAVGTDAYNDGLSQRRADSVKQWLVQSGKFSATAIRSSGVGKRRPVAANQNPDGSDNPVGRQKNRRVEVVATGSAAR